ncbi:MAG: hypothetical protein ACT4NX_01485 [Deltaproteobacteria bacterium]
MNNATRARLFIDKDGNWHQDGILIRHRWTYLHNNKLLDRDGDGRYFVDEGSGKLYVEIEDTPYIVKMVDRREDGFYYAILNDETDERLDLPSVRLNSENIAYARVKAGRFDARFSRPAYYEFAKRLAHDGEDFFIEQDGVKYAIKKSG